MSAVSEDAVIGWLRSMGYQSGAGEASLAKSNIAKLMKDHGSRHMWEHILARFRPVEKAELLKHKVEKAKADGIASSLQELSAAKASALRAAKLQALQERNQKLSAAVERQAAQIKSRMAEALQENGNCEQVQQQLQLTAMQGCALRHYHSRVSGRFPDMDVYSSNISHFNKAAHARMTATDPQAMKQLEQQIQQLCGELARQMQVHAQAQQDEQGEAKLRVLSGSSAEPSGRPLVALPDTQGLQPCIMALNTKCTPTATIQAFAKMLSKAMQQLRDSSVQIERSHRAGDGTSGHPSNPFDLIMSRQQAHVDRFMATEEMRVATDEARAQLEKAKAEVQQLMQWPYNQMRLQVANSQGQIATLRTEISRLSTDLSTLQHVDATLQEKFQVLQAGALKLSQLKELVGRLIYENSSFGNLREAQEAHFQVLAQEHLPKVASGTLKQLYDANNMVSSELEHARTLPFSCFLPASTHTDSAGTCAPAAPGLGASTPRRRPAGLERPSAPMLWRYQLVLPAAAHAKAGMLARGGSPHKYRQQQGGVGSSPEPNLAVVLRAGCAMDPLAPLRCPATLTVTIADGFLALLQQRSWLGQVQSLTREQRRQQEALWVQEERVRQGLERMRAEDKGGRLAQVQKYIGVGSNMIEYCRNNIAVAIEDYKSLPAIFLLPDHTHHGLSCADYYHAFETLHAEIRQAHEERLKAQAMHM